MCIYSGNCALCNYPLTIHAEQLDMNNAKIEVAPDCPNLQDIIRQPIAIDAMKEVIMDKSKSNVYKLFSRSSHLSECTAHDIIRDAIDRSLGRYYELA
ncbi:MAG: DUF6951 family protein [Clostridia bacterium]|jgi:hypothetical protein